MASARGRPPSSTAGGARARAPPAKVPRDCRADVHDTSGRGHSDDIALARPGAPASDRDAGGPVGPHDDQIVPPWSSEPTPNFIPLEPIMSSIGPVVAELDRCPPGARRATGYRERAMET